MGRAHVARARARIHSLLLLRYKTSPVSKQRRLRQVRRQVSDLDAPASKEQESQENDRSQSRVLSMSRMSRALITQNLIKAVNSIPAYIEKSNLFFAVCPEIAHLNLPGVVCNLTSWYDRGWCRIEMNSLALARKRRLTAPIVVQSSEGLCARTMRERL